MPLAPPVTTATLPANVPSAMLPPLFLEPCVCRETASYTQALWKYRALGGVAALSDAELESLVYTLRA